MIRPLTFVAQIALVALIALGLGTAPVTANAPEHSPRPEARAVSPATPGKAIRPHSRPLSEPATRLNTAALSAPANASDIARAPVIDAGLRPQSRPPSDQVVLAAAQAAALTPAQPGAQTRAHVPWAPDTSARPWPRPDSVVQDALFGRRKKRKGSVCGDIDIQGEKVGRVPGKLKGCGLKDAVRVRSVSGVTLSTPATLDCTTAKALNQWVRKSLKPTFRRRGPVVEIRVAAHYACRTRNNQPGGKISEHGRGKAIDISAFTMKDGEVITVAKGWGQGTTRKPLHQVHKAACGPFGTVLGPNADRYHRDHFHFDTAKHRGGPYCR